MFQRRVIKGLMINQFSGFLRPNQMQVLKESLRNLITGQSEVCVDMIAEAVYGVSKGISASEWQTQALFIWYDYFSCPQAAHMSTDGLQKAIDSIPAYVSRCDFFMALCPVLSNPHFTETFSEYTWAQRGWCRVERVVHELTFNHGSWIMVKSGMHQELRVSPLTNCSPGEGMFTVESDRERIAVVLERFWKRKLLSCLESMDLSNYRFLLNQQSSLLRGLPVKPLEDMVPGFEGDDVLERFLYQNGFRNHVEYDRDGWSPMCYACMNGNPSLIAALLKRGVSPNAKTRKGRPEINVDKGSALLTICARFRNHDAMRLLIDAKAMVNPQAVHTPLGVACLENDVQGIRILCEAGADPHLKNLFGDHALHMAAAGGSVDAVEVLLEVSQRPFEMSHVLHNAAMLKGTAPVVERLIEAGADVDEPYPMSCIARLVMSFKGMQFRYLKRNTVMARLGYHCRGSTPLMLAMLCGNYEVASSLLVEGALTDRTNARGKTALDLAEELKVPDYLLEALDGNIQKCTSIVAGSVGSVGSANSSPSMTMMRSMSRQSSSGSVFQI
ncbi:unnamed protein product [Durusdinium trenchii]|uniref:Ankyrin n=1 Tax=Durusdinium trenchii TaxID=1381693 RepID=A0ABP0J2V9_9DINO